MSVVLGESALPTCFPCSLYTSELSALPRRPSPPFGFSLIRPFVWRTAHPGAVSGIWHSTRLYQVGVFCFHLNAILSGWMGSPHHRVHREVSAPVGSLARHASESLTNS